MIGLRKFRLVSADARGRATRDEFLRESAWEASMERISSTELTAFSDQTDPAWPLEALSIRQKRCVTFTNRLIRRASSNRRSLE